MKRRGFAKGHSLIQLLIAAALICVTMMGLAQGWAFCFQVSVNNTDLGNAYNLGRKAIEEARKTGFDDTVEGTTTTYYLLNGSATNNSSQSRYKMTVIVSTDQMDNGVPAASARRTVQVTVMLTSTGKMLYASATYLVKYGI